MEDDKHDSLDPCQIGHPVALTCFGTTSGGQLKANVRLQEKDEYVDNIIHDLKALGFAYEQLSHTSDHFEPMLACARKLIAIGVLYADDTPVEQMREVPPLPKNCCPYRLHVKCLLLCRRLH